MIAPLKYVLRCLTVRTKIKKKSLFDILSIYQKRMLTPRLGN